MLDRHAVQELVRARLTAREIAKQLGVSVRTVRRIVREGAVNTGDNAAARSARHVGRPQVTDAIRARVQALLLEDPERPPGEICRLLRDDGTPLGLSTVYRVLASVRSTIPAALLVRFEGVAGEYAQFDFGEVSVRLTDGFRRTVHFAAYRLKYSRWVHVVLVPNERVEALIRSLLDSFAASGGVRLRVVFDNPKTVVLRHEEGRPVWNQRSQPCAAPLPAPDRRRARGAHLCAPTAAPVLWGARKLLRILATRHPRVTEWPACTCCDDAADRGEGQGSPDPRLVLIDNVVWLSCS